MSEIGEKKTEWKPNWIAIGYVAVVLIVLLIAWTPSTSTPTPKTERCGYCDRAFKEGTDDYRSIRRTNLCTSCYDSMKWMEENW